MKSNESPRPLIKAGWTRVLLFIIAIAVLMAITVGAYILTLPAGSSFARIAEKIQPEVIIILLFILSFGVCFVFRHWIDRQSFASLGFDVKGYLPEAISGVVLAVFIVGASSLILKATGHLRWTDIIFDPRSLFLAFGTIVLMALAEELVFRGYILGNLLCSFQRWPALLISAALFMIFHWSASGFLPLINTFILGLILGLNYSYTRNLWFSICFHVGWKFLEGPVLGISGMPAAQTLLQADMQGNDIATGAANGLEGSFVLMAVSLLSLLVLFIFLQRKITPQSPPVPGRI